LGETEPATVELDTPIEISNLDVGVDDEQRVAPGG